jgi:RNA polymerase sigma-70 factor, ECF subfamily
MRVDEPAIHDFLHTEYPRLVAAVALVSGSRASAEDSVQEALVKAWERSEKGGEIDSLRAWVATVALNHSRSGLRRLLVERRARRPVTPEDAFVAADRSLDVARALERLPRRQREAVVLRYYLRFDTKEVAEAMGVHDGTVKSNLARARATLAQLLGTPEPTTDPTEVHDRGSR